VEINNQKIQTELFPLSDKADELYKRLMREEGYIRDSLEKVQHYFGNQEVGRALISELTQAMREVRCAYCELEQLKSTVVEFTRVLTT
jgi:hypothetical protein